MCLSTRKALLFNSRKPRHSASLSQHWLKERSRCCTPPWICSPVTRSRAPVLMTSAWLVRPRFHYSDERLELGTATCHRFRNLDGIVVIDSALQQEARRHCRSVFFQGCEQNRDGARCCAGHNDQSPVTMDLLITVGRTPVVDRLGYFSTSSYTFRLSPCFHLCSICLLASLQYLLACIFVGLSDQIALNRQ